MNIDSIKRKIIASDKRYRLTTAFHEVVNNYKTSSPIFIFGCQRSGTTLVQKIIRLSPCVRSYGEGDAPYFDESGRLKEPDLIKSCLSKENNKYILLKPLCESQNARELLDKF